MGPTSSSNRNGAWQCCVVGVLVQPTQCQCRAWFLAHAHHPGTALGRQVTIIGDLVKTEAMIQDTPSPSFSALNLVASSVCARPILPQIARTQIGTVARAEALFRFKGLLAPSTVSALSLFLAPRPLWIPQCPVRSPGGAQCQGLPSGSRGL